MKKLITLFFLLTGMAAVRADDFVVNYGVGVVHIDLEVITDLKFYNAAEIGKLAQNLKFKSEVVDKKKKIKEATLVSGNEEKWLSPESFDMPGMLFTMRVMEKKSGWYYVMTNNSTRQCYWVRVVHGVDFNSWNDEVEFCLGVKRVDKDANPLRKAPNSNFTIPWDQKMTDCFKVAAVQGLWMRVETHKACAEGTIEVKEGWIRWRDEKDLLITYTPVPKVEKK